jgi:hypothetical protein
MSIFPAVIRMKVGHLRAGFPTRMPSHSAAMSGNQEIRKVSGFHGLAAIFAFAMLGLVMPVGAATSVSQYGITWWFSADRPVGQFANGDWWVLGPVTITNISPKTGDAGVDFSNGSMINIIPGEPQGLYRNGSDNHPENSPRYDATKNISLRLPVTVPPGSSVYSTMNNPDTWKGSYNALGQLTLDADAERVWFKETAVLTVLGTEPAAGSFRPPWAGTDKTIKPNWTVSSLDFSVLRSLPIPVLANAPSLAWCEEATRRPLLEMNFNWLNSNWKAAWTGKPGGYPRRTYGREVAGVASGAGLLLNTNLSDTQKQTLAIHMVQWGIDTYGLLLNGMQFQGSGGHQNGRLLPLYIAAKMLNDPDMLARLRGNYRFQEISTHFFVEKLQIDTPRAAPTPGSSKPNKPYTRNMLGMPEWCFGYASDPNNSAAWDDESELWNSSGYRQVNGGVNCGTVATILLMGGRSEVNHEPLFTYCINRYYPRYRHGHNAPFSGNSNEIEPFVRDMWDVHIDGGTVSPSTPPPGPDPTVTFATGDRIQVWGIAAVKSSADATSLDGYQNQPSLGTIVEGPSQPDDQGVTWFRIDYDQGIDGWSSRADFIKSQAPPASTFAVGDRIRVWRQAWANSTASVASGIATQPAQATGRILQGPVTNSTDNITWFLINYDSGVDGWSGADDLVKIAADTSPPPAGSGTVVEPAGNWSFEDGLNQWTVSGHYEHHISIPSLFAAEGLGFVSFNSGQLTPSAVFSRSVATIPGRTYVLRHKIGVLSFNKSIQLLGLKVSGAAQLAHVIQPIWGDGLGKSRWQDAEPIPFVADDTTTVIEFSDLSMTSDGIDLLLDEVVLTILPE